MLTTRFQVEGSLRSQSGSGDADGIAAERRVVGRLAGPVVETAVDVLPAQEEAQARASRSAYLPTASAWMVSSRLV